MFVQCEGHGRPWPDYECTAVIHDDIDFINLYRLYFLITFRLRIRYFYDFTGFKSQKLMNELKYSYFTGVL